VRKAQVKITLVLVVVMVSAGLIGAVSLAAPAETHGAISIAFDDSTQSQYDYAFPLMQARGIIGTFYVITDVISDFSHDPSYMSIAELQTLQGYGCEIASHSKTHPAFTGISDSQIREECSVSKQVLQFYGFAADNFAYPYGDRNDHTDSIVAEYYRSARSAYAPPYIMQLPTSQFLLPGCPGETGDPYVLPYLEGIVDEVDSTNGWAIIFFHNIIPDANSTPYTISSQDFESFLDYIIYKGVPTITVNQGLDLTSPPSPPPSVTISPTSVRMYLGQSQTFSSSVTDGNPPFSYQWCLNDTAVSGATGSTWTFTPATTGHYKVYLNVTDGLNFKAQSNIVTDIVVYPQLTVSISPVSVNMTVGASQTFSSTVSGGAPPYSYQWYRNGTAVSGATSANWTFTPTSAGTYIIYLRVADSNTAIVRSNNATTRVETPMTVTITPTQVKMYVGQSQTFSSSLSGGTAPYSYQWYLNDTAVLGATGSTWTFTPRSAGNYAIYLNVTDGFGFRVKSNVVDVSVYSVYLLLTVEPNQGSYSKGQLVTFTVSVFNGLNPAVESTLTLTVTGPCGYSYYDFQPMKVAANTVSEFGFTWVFPNVAGKYVVEAGLAPSLLTAYDTAWLGVA
jgi:peptidoglycan/xylan/chitin deacetylase (PgdA/CDA1 family)